MRLWKYSKNRIKTDISVEEMKKIIQNNKVILLDVRSIQEFNEGHLNGAINIPLYDLNSSTIEKIIKNKQDFIITYCSAGIRSKKAVKILKNMGYKNVYNLKEGVL